MVSALAVLSGILGWTSTLAWSISFYPQAILNYRRRSTKGLSYDFVYLNVQGFLAYSIYNLKIRSILHILQGPLPRADGSSIQARCRFKSVYHESGKRKEFLYLPDGTISMGRFERSESTGGTDVPTDITCNVPATFESRIDQLGAVYLSIRLIVGKLLTDTVKGEGVDASVIFGLEPIKLDIQR